MEIVTQLVTPFYMGEVDYDVLEFSVDRQARYGVDGVLVCGRWGEKSTLTNSEHLTVAKRAVKASKKRIKVYASAGSNDTAKSEYLSKELLSLGVDGIALTLPYYIKGKEKEIVSSAKKIKKLAQNKRVFMFYEGGKPLDKEYENQLYLSGIESVRADEKWGKSNYDGDKFTLNALCVNSTLFSVISNVFPSCLVHIKQKWDTKMAQNAVDDFFDLQDKINLLADKDVPALKYALSLWGLSYPSVRLPLIECDDEEKAIIRSLFD